MMKSISCILLVCLLGLMAYAEETQEQQVERLIKELQDPDSDVRSIAAVTLGEIGSEAKDAVPALIQLLQDQDAEGFVRANAALALREIGPEAKDAVPALIQALQDQDKYVRRDAAGALGKIGTPGAIKVAKDRYRAIVTLGWIGSKDEVPALIEALQNEDKDVRVNAAVTLREIVSEDAVPALIQALQGQDEWVRVNAAWALGEIGESAKDAVPALLQALQGQNKDVRKDVARALGNIGKDAMPALIQTLKNRNIDVRSSATWTLGVLRLMIVIGFIGVSGALIMTIWFGIVMWKHIVLRIEMGSDKGYHSSTKEDYSEYLGQTGVALTVLRPAGTAMIDNKRLDVVSVDDFIEVDMPIQVVGVNGAKVTVEKSRQQTG